MVCRGKRLPAFVLLDFFLLPPLYYWTSNTKPHLYSYAYSFSHTYICNLSNHSHTISFYSETLASSINSIVKCFHTGLPTPAVQVIGILPLQSSSLFVSNSPFLSDIFCIAISLSLHSPAHLVVLHLGSTYPWDHACGGGRGAGVTPGEFQCVASPPPFLCNTSLSAVMNTPHTLVFTI